ncbi:hypothetical protein BGZ70_002921 [Mortierella alpina]|uniref:DUF1279 domain-containing protein n=1 Tax=Mortierella alpina TaxID=64518 RepID=A0A9P6ITB6_MORAP|nr:hypothetical protein BGZ70_002921 [Mortierella alpina]
MNLVHWKPLGDSTLRHAAAVSIRSGFKSSVARSSRFHASAPATTKGLCTNSVRKTLYSTTNNGTHQSRLSALHPSSSLTATPTAITTASSRFASVVRRGFADKVTTSSSSSSSSTLSGAVSKQTTGSTVSAEPAKKLGFMDKMKQMIKQYGYTGVAVYFGISMIDLAATFVIVKAAGMDKIEKAQDWVLENIGSYFGYKAKPHDEDPHHRSKEADLDNVDDEQVGAIYNKASGLWSVFVIAYGIHKLLVPLRVVATGMITPPLVKWLVKRGWIKEVAKKGSAAGAAGSAATKA